MGEGEQRQVIQKNQVNVVDKKTVSDGLVKPGGGWHHEG